MFGGIFIKDEKGDSLIKWPTAKTEELFALFILSNNKNIDKWKIIENLWPKSETRKGEQQLYSTVYRLKKALEEAGIKAVIENKLGHYTLSIANMWCDVYEFKNLYEAFKKIKYVDEEIYNKLFSLYSGELFGSKDYTWSMLQKYALRRKFDELYNYIHKYYLAKGEEKKLIDIQAKRDLLDLE